MGLWCGAGNGGDFNLMAFSMDRIKSLATLLIRLHPPGSRRRRAFVDLVSTIWSIQPPRTVLSPVSSRSILRSPFTILITFSPYNSTRGSATRAVLSGSSSPARRRQLDFQPLFSGSRAHMLTHGCVMSRTALRFSSESAPGSVNPDLLDERCRRDFRVWSLIRRPRIHRLEQHHETPTARQVNI
jgi:hypothetical protein